MYDYKVTNVIESIGFVASQIQARFLGFRQKKKFLIMKASGLCQTSCDRFTW